MIKLLTRVMPAGALTSGCGSSCVKPQTSIPPVWRNYPETELLRQVEGIGALTALTFVLTLEDPYRFEKSRSVGAYLELVPATDQSGDRDPQKRISKVGDEMLSVSSW